ncbi:MAG: type II toxin-antitoxin system PemK/MazF family toxin [Actinomycetota bacterium]
MATLRRLGATLGAALATARAVQRERDRLSGRPRKQATPTARHAEVPVRIEYDPELDGHADPGEVVWTWVPYEDDPNQGKDRPVVIIGHTGRQLAGVALTSKNKQRDDAVAVGTGGWDPKRRPSWAKVDRLVTINPGDVRREGSVLDRQYFDDVVAGVGRYHTVIR